MIARRVCADVGTGWLHRATWTATELSITFPAPSAPTDPAGLTAITLMPRNAPETAGRWRVWLYAPGSDEAKLVYDRKVRHAALANDAERRRSPAASASSRRSSRKSATSSRRINRSVTRTSRPRSAATLVDDVAMQCPNVQWRAMLMKSLIHLFARLQR